MRKLLHTLAAAGLVATPFVSARADLILVSPDLVTIGGTGLGSVNTVLTFQSSGSNTTEAGCVSFNGSGDATGSGLTGSQCTGSSGDVKTGASQTQTRTLSQVGISSGSGFALFFNAAEPGGDGITLNSLAVTFYNSAGVAVHTATFAGSHDFTQTATGTGNTGYLFALNGTQASALDALISSLGAGNIHVGVSATAGTGLGATGGNETFFIFNQANTPVFATPEPSTTALLATGLFGLVGVVRRRRRS